MLSLTTLSTVADCCYAECLKKAFIPNVTMLNVVMLSVMARKARVFDTITRAHPNLLFVCYVGAYPSRAPYCVRPYG